MESCIKNGIRSIIPYHHVHHRSHDKKRDSGIFKRRKTTGISLFGLGFINMIIPRLAVGTIIYGIFRTSTLTRTISRSWIETAVMQTIGAVTVFFGTYSLFLPS